MMILAGSVTFSIYIYARPIRQVGGCVFDWSSTNSRQPYRRDCTPQQQFKVLFLYLGGSSMSLIFLISIESF